jgi:hypothetical protein
MSQAAGIPSTSLPASRQASSVVLLSAGGLKLNWYYKKPQGLPPAFYSPGAQRKQEINQ